MKTINDLDFTPHDKDGWMQAKIHFPNHYGISVLQKREFSRGKICWEVAILYKGCITYNTPLSDDVIEFSNAKSLNDFMMQVQDL